MQMSNTEVATGQPAGAPQTIRVLLADDHRITLWGLKQLIDSAQPRMEVVGAVTTRDELLAHPALTDADVILLDLDLAGTNAAASLDDLARLTHAQVLVLTAEESIEVHRDAVIKGARGVLHKSVPADQLLRAIEKVAEGEYWLDARLLGQLMGALTGQAGTSRRAGAQDDPVASLTVREREIIETMVRLPSAKQLVIALELGMSEHTLRNHLTTIYDKLGVRGRMAMYLFATEHGLVARPPLPPA